MTTAPTELTTDDVAQLAGATYRQIDYWHRMGYLKSARPGSGRERVWGPDDVIRATALVATSAIFRSPELVADVARVDEETGLIVVALQTPDGRGLVLTIGEPA